MSEQLGSQEISVDQQMAFIEKIQKFEPLMSASDPSDLSDDVDVTKITGEASEEGLSAIITNSDQVTLVLPEASQELSIYIDRNSMGIDDSIHTYTDYIVSITTLSEEKNMPLKVQTYNVIGGETFTQGEGASTRYGETHYSDEGDSIPSIGRQAVQMALRPGGEDFFNAAISMFTAENLQGFELEKTTGESSMTFTNARFLEVMQKLDEAEELYLRG